MGEEMKTFVAKATYEYHIERQYHKATMTLRVKAFNKKSAIREIKNLFHEKYGFGTFNIIYIDEICIKEI